MGVLLEEGCVESVTSTEACFLLRGNVADREAPVLLAVDLRHLVRLAADQLVESSDVLLELPSRFRGTEERAHDRVDVADDLDGNSACGYVTCGYVFLFCSHRAAVDI